MLRLFLFPLLFPVFTSALAQRRTGCSQCPHLQTISPNEKSGTIKSPGFPEEYCDGLDCTWVIKSANPGSGLRLHFDQFETEPNADWLQIVFVKGALTKNLTRLSGAYDESNLPNFVFGDDATIELIFHTDSSFRDGGFLAKFERFTVSKENCVCPEFLHSASRDQDGSLSSPNYPESYCHEMQCYYLIQAEPNDSIRLTIDQFETEPRYDYLEIYDDSSANKHKLLRRLNGTVESGTKLESKTSSILLIFRSDGDKNHPGFKINFRSIKGLCSCQNVTLTGTSGQFKSIGFPHFYCPDVNCNYTIRVPENKTVQVDIPFYRVHGYRDSLTIAAANGLQPFPYMAKQSMQSGFRFTAQGNEIVLNFKTWEYDRDYHQNETFGFNATFLAVPSSDCKCPMVDAGVRGTLKFSACGPLDCFYQFSQPSPNRTVFRLAPKQLYLCHTDYIRLMKRMNVIQTSGIVPLGHQGEDESKSRVVIMAYVNRFSDSENKTFSVEEKEGIIVQFHANTTGESKAELIYEWLTQTCDCSDSGKEMEATSTPQLLTSPGYPVPYCNNLRCSWFLRAPPNHLVVVNVSDLETEFADPLLLYDGEGVNEQLITTLNRTGPTEQTIFKSRQQTMTIKFKTDTSVIYRGWKLTYYSEANKHEIPLPQTTPEPRTIVQYVSVPSEAQSPDDRGNFTGLFVDRITDKMADGFKKISFGVPIGWVFATGLLLGLMVCVIAVGAFCLKGPIRKRIMGASNPPIRFNNSNHSPPYIINDAYDDGLTRAPSVGAT